MTQQKWSNWMRIVFALSETIRELGRVPAGHLYAVGMASMTLEQYNAAISQLEGAGLVKQDNHELIWIGPNFPKEGK
jgi:hypothetical protein